MIISWFREGHHPLLAYCDNTTEGLAWMLRPGSAGSNTAADHLQITDAAITAVPARHRRKLMVTCDGAGASHKLIGHLDELAARPGRELTYSVGWELGARERAAIGLVPAAAWQIAIDARGEVRERRADDACRQPSCAHARCWIEEAHVSELTGLLREGPDGDQLTGWPPSMRVFARRERPHPGAQLSLFEAADGWRYSLHVTNLPASLRGWRSQPAYIDAAHRVHARVEDRIRTGKDTGIGHFPSQSLAINAAWLTASLIAATLLAWLAHLALDGDLARAEPKTLRQDPARRRPAHPRQPPPAAENRRNLALGHRHRRRLDPDQRPAAGSLTRRKPAQRPRKDTPRGPWNPRHPARQPGHRHTPNLKSSPATPLSGTH